MTREEVNQLPLTKRAPLFRLAFSFIYRSICVLSISVQRNHEGFHILPFDIFTYHPHQALLPVKSEQPFNNIHRFFLIQFNLQTYHNASPTCSWICLFWSTVQSLTDGCRISCCSSTRTGSRPTNSTWMTSMARSVVSSSSRQRFRPRSSTTRMMRPSTGSTRRRTSSVVNR